MEWTKIPTDILQSRIPDKEIVAIVKYQLLWAMLEREPSEDLCIRYMTKKQYQQARLYYSSIKQRIDGDIKSVESHRRRQKLFYQKSQALTQKSDGHTDGQTDGQTVSHTDNPDKIRIDKNINNPPISNDIDPLIKEETNKKRFVKPSLEEIKSYCLERKNNVDPERFYSYYSSNGWKVGRNPMKDWKSAVRLWERNYKSSATTTQAISKSAQIARKNLVYVQSLMEGIDG